MSGHSKWHNIQAKKGKADAARGKVFTKLGRELLIAVKEGGPDPAGNSKLKNVIAKCKAANMPNDTINNAIKKASGSNESYEEVTYEGYGTNGVAVIVSAATDNRNRTAPDVRHLFDKYSGNLGQPGCVSFMFDKKGSLGVLKEGLDEDEFTLTAIDAGAEDVIDRGEAFEIITAPEDYIDVRKALEDAGHSFIESEITYIPQTTTELTDEEDIKNMDKLIDALEDNDDVTDVYTSWERD